MKRTKTRLLLAAMATVTIMSSCNKDVSNDNPNPSPGSGGLSKDTFLVYVNDDKNKDEIHAYNLNKKEDKFLFYGSSPHIVGTSIVWLEDATVYYGKLTSDNILYKRKVFFDPNIDIKTVQLSNDKSKIVFDTRTVSTNAIGISIIDTNGVSVKQLAVTRRNFSWISFSPNDSKLYYASQQNNNQGLIITYTFSSNKYDTIWKATDNTTATDPVEVDGKIYFIRNHALSQGYDENVYSLNLDGTGAYQTTNLSTSTFYPAINSLRKTMGNKAIFTMGSNDINQDKTFTMTTNGGVKVVNFKAISPNIFTVQ
ncbi:MAG: hypothetical protein J0I41_00190 [Filimonas sp.]|nr:hypothetical protein [Filimonas sp.]